MTQKNLLQFVPYYPPHTGWLEKVAQDIAENWKKHSYWNSYVITSQFWIEQENNFEKIIFEGREIWYIQNGVEVLIVPSYEIVTNFPVYNMFSPEYKKIIQYVSKKDLYCMTHTRFFFSSFIWTVHASKNNRKHIHLEHGSAYVKSGNTFVDICSIFYDKTLWIYILKKADSILAISKACKNFLQENLLKKNVSVWYRWIEIPAIKRADYLHNKFPEKIIVWYIGRLYKWKNVHNLIWAYYELEKNIQDQIQLVIVWDWPEYNNLMKSDVEKKIFFSWRLGYQESLEYQSEFDIHIHPSAPWWGLATTLLQAICLWCYIVATPNEWADEVIADWKNGILLESHSVDTIKQWLTKAVRELEMQKESYGLYNKQFEEKHLAMNVAIQNLYNVL